MIGNNLIKQCVCGNQYEFDQMIINEIDVVKCKKCGTIHQELFGWTIDKYVNFYKTDYHNHYQEKKGVMTYSDRYDHDRKIAKLRLDEYKNFIKPKGIGLDIGSSNSAFVHECREKGYYSWGLEPGDTIGDDKVTLRGTLETVKIARDYFDFVTMHDSIEHMTNVNFALDEIYASLKEDGILILDLPDYFVPAGRHHWKYIEHLWFFTRDDMVTILKDHKFDVFKITEPIPGKLVFYSRKT